MLPALLIELLSRLNAISSSCPHPLFPEVFHMFSRRYPHREVYLAKKDHKTISSLTQTGENPSPVCPSPLAAHPRSHVGIYSPACSRLCSQMFCFVFFLSLSLSLSSKHVFPHGRDESAYQFGLEPNRNVNEQCVE